MTSTTTQSANTQASHTGAGPFMLTLCRLDAPIAIRPPQSPLLKSFKFFMSRARRKDGSEDLYLHMGYFASLDDAKKWLQVMRPKYPQAVATPTPPVVLRQAQANVPPLAPPAEPPVLRQISPAEGSALTDTQVLQILEKRRVGPDSDAGRTPDRPEISVLRPEDTHTRRLLKEAVIQGAPVLFVAQLVQRNQPIDLSSVPSLDIFRAYTLYAVEGRREGGNSWHALRLGFFKDAVSAKQVAHYMRDSFESIAVIPINEQESLRAKQSPIAISRLAGPRAAGPLHKSIDDMLASDRSTAASTQRSSSSSASNHFTDTSVLKSGSQPKPAAGTRKDRSKDSLEQTLELLASSEIWNNPESLEETGVRHLKVEMIQKRRSGRA